MVGTAALLRPCETMVESAHLGRFWVINSLLLPNCGPCSISGKSSYLGVAMGVLLDTSSSSLKYHCVGITNGQTGSCGS
jgi:hypothetical protein